MRPAPDARASDVWRRNHNDPKHDDKSWGIEAPNALLRPGTRAALGNEGVGEHVRTRFHLG